MSINQLAVLVYHCRVGAKDRVLYIAYLELCKQLDRSHWSLRDLNCGRLNKQASCSVFGVEVNT